MHGRLGHVVERVASDQAQDDVCGRLRVGVDERAAVLDVEVGVQLLGNGVDLAGGGALEDDVDLPELAVEAERPYRAGADAFPGEGAGDALFDLVVRGAHGERERLVGFGIVLVGDDLLGRNVGPVEAVAAVPGDASDGGERHGGGGHPPRVGCGQPGVLHERPPAGQVQPGRDAGAPAEELPASVPQVFVAAPVRRGGDARDGLLVVVGADVAPAEVGDGAEALPEPAGDRPAVAGGQADRPAGDGGDNHGGGSGRPQHRGARLVHLDDARRDVLIRQVVGHVQLAGNDLRQVPVVSELGVLVEAHDGSFFAAVLRAVMDA